jgi:hypothetical protein
MTQRNLPPCLPPALPLPFHAGGPVDVDLFDKPALPVERCGLLARIWSQALREGVAAAVTHDHALFERLPGRHDPESLNGIYTDSPLVSPWTPANVAHQLPPMERAGVRALTDSLWLLEWDTGGTLAWELIVPALLDDAPRTAFWAGAMVIEFGHVEEDRAASARFGIAAMRRSTVGLELDIRQTPFGIWCPWLPRATPPARRAAKRWMLDHLPGLLQHMSEDIAPFDNPGDHELFAVPLMLDPETAFTQAGGVLH